MLRRCRPGQAWLACGFPCRALRSWVMLSGLAREWESGAGVQPKSDPGPVTWPRRPGKPAGPLMSIAAAGTEPAPVHRLHQPVTVAGNPPGS